uniref:Uncharacterized protein n=1 Tax=Parascaris univalens TaxID=6257 RepID=A0A915A164_PARUN
MVSSYRPLHINCPAWRRGKMNFLISCSSFLFSRFLPLKEYEEVLRYAD